jgi:polysaccharide export outer membrane protein
MHGAQKKDLSQIIHNAVSREFKSFKLDVNLTGLRTIRILLTGNVTQPGLKNLVAGSSLLDALSISGGVHKDGSLRSIRVKSKNGTLQQIDLYELLFKGNQAVDLQLHSGDQIIIPPIGETTCLLGATGQGIYETKGESLKDLLKIHGQINAFVAQERIFFEKTIKQKSREVYSIDINKALEMKLKDGFIFEFQSIRNELDNTVEISGEVSRPGKYPWTPGMTVKDLIDKSDGFLLKASLHKALIRRRLNGEAIYQKAGGLGITRVREELIWLPLDKILAGDDSQNIELQRFDTLRIMAITDLQDTPQVEIIGAIRKSGAYNLSQNMTLLDLVTLAGNPAKSAYPGQGVIVRKVYNRQKHNFDVKMYHFNVLDVINHKQSSLITLEDGDRVIIRTSASYSVKVSINGQVQFPGSYILPSNSKITDLIKAAGGLLSRADLRAAEFSRESIRKLQEKRLDELFEKTRQRLTRSRSTMTRDGRLKESYASTMELRSLEKLKNDMFSRQIKGRIVLNFLQKDFPKSYDNLNLEENDNLIIPQKMNSIMVMGHVYSPNAYIWRKNMTVKDYLNMSGGYRDEAGKDELYLVLSSGQVKSVKQIGHSKLMATIPGPGDSILIPKKELERSNLAVASDYISILRQAAELGAISNAIPNANEAKIGINSDQSTRQVNGGSYNPLMK